MTLDRILNVWPLLNSLHLKLSVPTEYLYQQPHLNPVKLWSLSQGISYVLMIWQSVPSFLRTNLNATCTLLFHQVRQMFVILLWLAWIELCCPVVRAHSPHSLLCQLPLSCALQWAACWNGVPQGYVSFNPTPAALTCQRAPLQASLMPPLGVVISS